ncbi:MAG: hypothetical protein IJR14_09060 [Synergistaceae bacterium]|nr:hypothetical protein [Synergistaceae bacterium]
MPSRKVYDIKVRTSSYTTRDGEERGRWDNVGAVFVHEGNDGDRPYILLKRTFNPAGLDAREGSDTVLLSLFKPKPKDGGSFYGEGAYYGTEEAGPHAGKGGAAPTTGVKDDAPSAGGRRDWDPDDGGHTQDIPF